MAITNALNPTVVQTELDAIFVQEYMFPVAPGTATATTPEIFKQEGVDNSAHIEAVLSGGGGLWSVKGEEVPVATSSPRVANKVTYVVVTVANSLQISKEFFDDNMHGTYSAMVKKFAMGARATREILAFEIYRGAFTTTLTADGVALVDDAHTTIGGGTVDNQVASNAVLSPTALNTAMVQLQQQKSQDGIIMGQLGSILLVPSALYKTACEIVGSQLASGTANNDINVYSSTYQISVFQSPYLGSAVAAGTVNGVTVTAGSDTMWFLMSRNHGVTRYVRQELTTDLVDYIYSTNNNYVYKGMFREVYGVTDYVGIVGSTGAGA